MVTDSYGPIAVRTLGRFIPIPFRSGRFGQILQVGRFGQILVGRFSSLYFCSFLGNKKFFLLGRLILCSIVSESNTVTVRSSFAPKNQPSFSKVMQLLVF